MASSLTCRIVSSLLSSAVWVAASGTGLADPAAPDLKPGTPYHYRMVAENEAGTSPGLDATFQVK